jgi:chaperonin GroES
MSEATVIKPLHKALIIKELPKEEKTATGLYIPDSVTTPLSRASIICIGEKCESKLIKAGDTILFRTGTGSPIVSNDETFLLIDEGNCVAVV